MFNSSFYPSTERVIELMIAPHRKQFRDSTYLKGIERILEPSAGKGDIADYIHNHFGIDRSKVHCCEMEEELALILQAKGYPVVERNFLNYDEPCQFDIILMNPPFANAAEHILKAWHVLRYFGGDIVAQVNVETIDNPFDHNRQQLAKLIEKYGSVERIGQPYRTAERPTSVEVAIVRLKRVVDSSHTSFGDFSDYAHDGNENTDTFERNELASADKLAALVASYNAARQVIIEKSELDGKFYFYTKQLGGKSSGTPEEVIDKQRQADESERKKRAIELNKNIAALKVRFWDYLFKRTKIADIATSKVQAEFKKFAENTGNLAFTVENVQRVFSLIAMQLEQIRSDCITQVFDKLCSYDGENTIHHEGWVTNDNYRVNRKVIIPVRAANYDGEWRTWWDSVDQTITDDIDKALCFVTGMSFTTITTIYDAVINTTERVCDWRKREPTDWDGRGAAPLIDSEFFKIRIFKKGTIHLTFKSEDVWEKFNIAAAEGKNWIGAQTRHKSAKTRAKQKKDTQKTYDSVYSRKAKPKGETNVTTSD